MELEIAKQNSGKDKSQSWFFTRTDKLLIDKPHIRGKTRGVKICNIKNEKGNITDTQIQEGLMESYSDLQNITYYAMMSRLKIEISG